MLVEVADAAEGAVAHGDVGDLAAPHHAVLVRRPRVARALPPRGGLSFAVHGWEGAPGKDGGWHGVAGGG